MSNYALAVANRSRLLSEEPEFVIETLPSTSFGVIEKKLTTWERLYNLGYVRKLFLLFVFAALWQIYGSWLGNSLLFPTFAETLSAFWDGIWSG